MNEKDTAFFDNLAEFMAADVLEDEAALARELDREPQGRKGARDRLRAAALKVIGTERRKLIMSRPAEIPAIVRTDRYAGLPRIELMALCAQRAASGQMSVQHRDLQDLSDDDLRSMLEDFDLLNSAENDDGKE